MNEVESQEAEIQWVDSEVDNDSDASDSDGTDGEVPDVTEDITQPDSTNINAVPGGAARLYSNTLPVRGPLTPTIATAYPKDSPFAGGWKPVIDGKIQVVGEAALKGRSSQMQLVAGAASSQKQSSSDGASPSPSPAATGISEPKKDGNESDSDVRRVPEMAAKGTVSGATSSQPQGQTSARSRKRGGASADKEHKRLKRLLRNRVSAQQARERKKAYLSDLEVRSKELQQRNEELEEKVSTLQRENYMLRQIVKNTALKKTGGGDGPMPMQQ